MEDVSDDRFNFQSEIRFGLFIATIVMMESLSRITKLGPREKARLVARNVAYASPHAQSLLLNPVSVNRQQ